MGAPDDRFASRLLEQEIVTSVGCTEPAALALAAAAAAARTTGRVEQIRVRADLGTFKNALAVGLPGTSQKGPAIVAAVGSLVRDPSLGLQVLGAVTAAQWEKAAALAQRVRVLHEPWREVRIEAEVTTADGTGRASIQGRHDRLDRPVAAPDDGHQTDEIDDAEIVARLGSARQLVSAVDSLDGADLARVADAVETNRRLAEYGFEEDAGWGTGRAFRDTGDDPVTVTKAWVSAAIDARMSGAPLPAATSGGSGNSGIVVSLGAWTAARNLGTWSNEEVLRATALAHLVNIAVKARIGRVGPLCGGAHASAMGVGCAIAWLLHGREEVIDRVIRHVVNATSGTLCDGAKPGCALRIASGLGVAVDAARFAAGGHGRIGNAGLAGESGASALERLQQLSAQAFSDVDSGLVEILIDQSRWES